MKVVGAGMGTGIAKATGEHVNMHRINFFIIYFPK
jgi:hypothetical protein